MSAVMLLPDVPLRAIRPAVRGRSDKFSWRLYAFIERQARKRFPYTQLWHSQHAAADMREDWPEREGLDVERPLRRIHPHTMFLSWHAEIDDGFLSAARLSRIMGQGRETFAYSARHWGFTNISEPVWRRYLEVGRCAFYEHDALMMHDDGRYTVVGNTRRCNWCGAWQEASVVKVVRKPERCTVWSEVRA